MESEQLDGWNEARAELPECVNCNHPYHAGECELEHGDWGPCGCTNYEAE